MEDKTLGFMLYNEPQSSSLHDMPCINGQTLQSQELLDGRQEEKCEKCGHKQDGRQEEKCEKCGHKQGSHQWKRPVPIFSVLCIAAIIIIAMLAPFILWGTKEPSAGPCLNASCPESWIGYKGRCYYFSETEGTWDLAQKNCSSYGASLAAIDSLGELGFLMRLKGPSDSWIGLRREYTEKPWKWTNGSLFNNWFNITAHGLCAYLEDGVSSTWCDTPRHWICRKS